MSQINQLLSYFIPENYRLHLIIDKPNRSFTGQVTITGQPKSDEIRLHAKNLTIIKVQDTNGTLGWTTTDDELIIPTKDSQLTIDFSGVINEDSMNGLYLCKYQVADQPKELFATQFESHYARECFPCIDEPAAKATFDISIESTNQSDNIILSNMPGHKAGSCWIFDTTPRMSTYLVAFVGGELISKSGATNRGTEVVTYATPVQPADSLDYALEVAIKSIEYFERYFGVNYPLPKLDNVALPDFSAGAMENWGLITYRETAMLADDSTSQDDREQIATVIAHEISHQWFGNLVTMQWWNDLWLNESFASMMEHMAVDYMFPEYKIWQNFVSNDVLNALRRDSLTGVQAVRQDVNSPADISALFDGAIVYAKGERLMRMICAYIGEKTFRQGLTNYFTKYAYKNTVADDLWQELSLVSGLDIGDLMSNWLTKPGYPVVNVTLNGTELQLSQHRFTVDGKTNNDDTIWQIPLFAGDSLPRLMTDKTMTVKLSGNQAVHFNIGDYSHYIVNYDDQLLDNIVANFHKLNDIDKIKLLHESLLLSLAGIRDVSYCVKLLYATKGDSSQLVLDNTSWLIANLNRLTKPDTELRERLKKLTGQLFNPEFDRLFNTNNTLSINDQKAKAYVLSRSIYADYQPAIDYCQKLFTANRTDIVTIDSNIRATVLSAVAKNGDKGVFNELWQLYQTTPNALLKQDICCGLTATKDHQLINILLDAATNTNLIKPQDNMYFIIYLMNNPKARTMTWQWIRNNWDWIKRVFGGDMSYDVYVRTAGNNLSTDEELAEYDEFFASIDNAGIERAIQLGHNNICSRIDWIKRNVTALSEALTNLE